MVISVAGDAALICVVEPRENLRQEIGLLVRAPAGRKFRDPNLTPSARRFRFGHVIFEVSHTGIGRKPIPMDSDEINRAVIPTGAEKTAKPIEPHVVVIAIAHGRRAELGFAGVGLQISFPRFDGRFRREIGLCG